MFANIYIEIDLQQLSTLKNVNFKYKSILRIP